MLAASGLRPTGRTSDEANKDEAEYLQAMIRQVQRKAEYLTILGIGMGGAGVG